MCVDTCFAKNNLMALVPHKELGCIFIAAVCTAVVRLKANKFKDYEISVSSCLLQLTGCIFSAPTNRASGFVCKEV